MAEGFASIMGRLRALGCQDLRREGSVLKQLLRRHSAEEVNVALDGLETLFPGEQISLRMIYGKSMIGSYRGFVSATNSAIKAQEKRD